MEMGGTTLLLLLVVIFFDDNEDVCGRRGVRAGGQDRFVPVSDTTTGITAALDGLLLEVEPLPDIRRPVTIKEAEPLLVKAEMAGLAPSTVKGTLNVSAGMLDDG